MILAGIIDQTIIGLFKIDEGVKLDNLNYFMDYTLFAWYNSQSQTFKLKYLFMHDNAPSHLSKLTHKFFEYKKI